MKWSNASFSSAPCKQPWPDNGIGLFVLGTFSFSTAVQIFFIHILIYVMDNRLPHQALGRKLHCSIWLRVLDLHEILLIIQHKHDVDDPINWNDLCKEYAQRNIC